jgi:hypothetical protein
MIGRSGSDRGVSSNRILMNRHTLLLAVVISVSAYADPKAGTADASAPEGRTARPELSEMKDDVKTVVKTEAKKGATKVEDWLQGKLNALRVKTGTPASVASSQEEKQP